MEHCQMSAQTVRAKEEVHADKFPVCIGNTALQIECLTWLPRQWSKKSLDTGCSRSS